MYEMVEWATNTSKMVEDSSLFVVFRIEKEEFPPTIPTVNRILERQKLS